MKTGNGTNFNLQNIAQKTNDRATRTRLKIGDELKGSGSSSCTTYAIVLLLYLWYLQTLPTMAKGQRSDFLHPGKC
jgi:hypothetical protein